jgi:hypothetical protein
MVDSGMLAIKTYETDIDLSGYSTWTLAYDFFLAQA